MPIGNLSGKLPPSDVNKVRDRRNHPEYEPGFEGGDESADFSSLFDDLGDDGMEFPSSSGGGDNSGLVSSFFASGAPNQGAQAAPGQPLNGQQSGLSSWATPIGGVGGPNPFGPQPQGGDAQQVQKKAEPDTFDKLCEISGIALGSMGKITMQAFKSLKNRTADDLGYYGTRLMIVSGIMLGIVVLMSIMGIIGNLDFIKFPNFPFQLLLASLLVFGTGSITLGASAYYILSFNRDELNDIDAVPDIKPQMEESQDAYENDIQDLLGDLFGGGEDDDYFTDEEEESDYAPDMSFDPDPEPVENTDNSIKDFEGELGKIAPNAPIINRAVLFDTFKPFFPTNTNGFSDRREIEPDSEEFYTLEALCMRALASAGRLELEDATDKSELVSAVNTYFTYELKLKRIKGMTKLEDIEREMVAYFRDSSNDTSVSCSADLEGGLYKITLNKGESAVITLGDLFTLDTVVSFFKNTKNMLPIIAGISEDGQPILTDAKLYDTMLIAGKPRSGKSWYVLELMWTMMVFNVPDDVQFLVIDPKESNLFKTLALMPHVCGLHNDANILAILKDVIEKEGSRRKKLLSDNRCENVWDLKKKGIQIPILYIVIDEVMTVIANLGSNSKEFFEQMKVIVSQLPSQGIRLIFVPHRSQGVVDKTVRTNIGFTAAVRADTEVVCETLDIKKWTTPLLNPGDTALKMQGFGKEIFVHGPAVTTDDGENTEHIIAIAKAFYKMGIDIPEMYTIGMGYNRDIEFIKNELGVGDGSNRVQFDINDVSDIDLNNL